MKKDTKKLLLIGGAVGALFLFLRPKGEEQTVQGGSSPFGELTGGFEDVGNALNSTLGGLGTFLQGAGTGLGNAGGLPQGTGIGLGAALTGAGNLGQGLGSGLGDAFSGFGSGAQGTGQGINSIFSGAAILTNSVNNTGLVQGATNAVTFPFRFGVGLGQAFQDIVGGTSQTKLGSLINANSNSNTSQGIQDSTPKNVRHGSFFTGGIALHEGENVPANHGSVRSNPKAGGSTPTYTAIQPAVNGVTFSQNQPSGLPVFNQPLQNQNPLVRAIRLRFRR